MAIHFPLFWKKDMFVLLFVCYGFSTTWDEHLFELLLPAGASGAGAVQAGHIDLKLNFIPAPPNPLPVLQVSPWDISYRLIRK